MTVLYVYVLYPLTALLRAWIRPRPYQAADITPPVTVIVAAYNEAATIARKLENLLRLDYPSDLMQLIVVSDGSTDDTEEVVRRTFGNATELIRIPRTGKSAALQRGAAEASGTILVFTDANSLLAPAALRNLVRPFADPSVGAVAGDQRYVGGRAVSIGERGYWAMERQLKAAESRAGSTVAATGSLYAVRRALFHGIPAGVNDDYYISARVIIQGYRLVFAADATSFEPVMSSLFGEYTRKVRIMTGALHTEFALRGLLNPFRFGWHSVVFASHKVMRRLLPVPLLVMAISGFRLRQRRPMYRLAAMAQLVWYGLGLAGFLALRARRPVPRILAIPAYFAAANGAALVALWNGFRGRKIESWRPERGRNQM